MFVPRDPRAQSAATRLKPGALFDRKEAPPHTCRTMKGSEMRSPGAPDHDRARIQWGSAQAGLSLVETLALISLSGVLLAVFAWFGLDRSRNAIAEETI